MAQMRIETDGAARTRRPPGTRYDATSLLRPEGPKYSQPWVGRSAAKAYPGSERPRYIATLKGFNKQNRGPQIAQIYADLNTSDEPRSRQDLKIPKVSSAEHLGDAGSHHEAVV